MKISMISINKNILAISIMILSKYLFAVVPIENVNDVSTMATVTTQMGTYLQQLNSAQNTYQQVQALKGLQQIQASGQGLCDLCSPRDAQTLTTYVNQINSDLCSQFSNIMSNLINSQSNFKNLQDIIGLMKVNPQAASIGLQQTSTSLLSNMQSTLTQMNALQAQQLQKDLAKEKMNKQAVNDWHSGYNNK